MSERSYDNYISSICIEIGKGDTNEFPCCGGGEQSSATAAAV